MRCRFIVGCGYVGLRIANLWRRQGDTVYAVTRSRSRTLELRDVGILPIVWNWLEGGSPVESNELKALRNQFVPSQFAPSQIAPSQIAPSLDTILVAVPHSPQPNVASNETHTRGLDNLVKLFEAIGFDASHAKWIYLSTTGVFGPSSPGEWVDEDSLAAPERPGSIAALAGEKWIASPASDRELVVLRPAGIYGPGRVPNWQAVRDGLPLQVDPESYLNLIHVDDLTTTIGAVSDSRMQYHLYCISDGVPVRRREYYKYISEIGNLPEPVFDTFGTSSFNRTTARSDGNKRVRNNRIQNELAIRLQYPTYREGLRSLLVKTGDYQA